VNLWARVVRPLPQPPEDEELAWWTIQFSVPSGEVRKRL